MKIIFEKLQTSNENVYVDFGNGTWQSFPVNEAKANGIIIPDTCSDYSKIRIKGSTTVLPNMDVITGIKSIEEQKCYSTPLTFGNDYDNIYIGNYLDNLSELYVYYDNKYFQIGQTYPYLCEKDLECDCIKLDNDILPISMNFQLSVLDGQISIGSSNDPENLVNILTYEKGVGGTASIKGVEVNYKTDSPEFDENNDYSIYYWDSPSISDYGTNAIFITEDGYETFDGMCDKLKESLLNSNNGAIYVYAEINNEYYKMPIKLI